MGDIEQLQRSKRYLTFFSGILFLHLVAGIRDADSGTIGPITLEKWDQIGLILSFVVSFYLLRILNFRSAEGEKYKDSIQYRIDDYIHLFVGVGAISNGFVQTIWGNVYEENNAFVVSAVVAVVSFVVVFVLYLIFNDFRSRQSRSRSSMDHRIAAALRTSPWFLIYANHVGQTLREGTNYKPISFEPNGDIGQGNNQNETRWRIREGFLEILNKNEVVFSRFSYDEGREQFRATGDSDLKALPEQRIVRDVDAWDSIGRP
tara:strand:+ start:369 stop:1151 length:783 start_codon:yes stop_codon:yes gene_type:complete